MKRSVALLMVLVMLGSVMPAMANGTEPTCNCDSETGCEVMLKRVVEVEVLKNGGTILNVTEVNQTLNDWVYAKFGKNIGYQDGTFDYRVETKEIYHHLTKGRDLKFSEVRVHNNTASFSFHVLSYSAKTATYNFSLVTRIIKGGKENYFVTVINIAPKDKKKFAPFADVIEIRSKTTLAEHYRILAKVLSKMGGETSWDKAKNELNELAKRVELDLANYNLRGTGIAFVTNNDCSYLCNIVCGSGFAILCLAGGIIGGPLIGAICSVSTSVGCTAICGEVCSDPVGLEDLTCAGACDLFFVTPVCSKLGVAAPICEKFMTNIGICTLICDQVGNLFGG